MNNQKLFSYGTLQQEEVQLATFHRKLVGGKDILSGFTLSEVFITDPDIIKKSGKNIHPVIVKTGNCEDKIHGMVFDISQEELVYSDKYEVQNYKRISVKLASGLDAWVYVNK